MAELARAACDPEDRAREFEPTAQSIRKGIARADKTEGRQADAPPCLSAVERDELSRLRRENRQFRVERDILSKAVARFVRG
jgi:transposase